MTPTHLSRTPVVAFDPLESLADPAALSTILGPLAGVERERLPGISAGFSNSSHEILAVVLPDWGRRRRRWIWAGISR